MYKKVVNSTCNAWQSVGGRQLYRNALSGLANWAIIDCIYNANVLTNLSVRHRVRVAHSLLPLKCCYSPSGQGYLISGSEDKEVYIYCLAKTSNYKMQYLKHHPVPVVAVAVNKQDTLLASADSLGRIVLWRRMDYSHLPD